LVKNSDFCLAQLSLDFAVESFKRGVEFFSLLFKHLPAAVF
jgi:exonuclease VII small subunit